MSAVAKLKARMSLPFETVERSEYEELIARPTQCDYNRATARSLELHLEMEALKRDAQAQLDALTEALTAASNEREAQLKAACQDDIHAAQEDKSAALEQLEALAIENAKLESICLKLDSVKEKLISKHEREIATLNKDHKAKLQKLNEKLKKADIAKDGFKSQLEALQSKHVELKNSGLASNMRKVDRASVGTIYTCRAEVTANGQNWTCYSIDRTHEGSSIAKPTKYFKIGVNNRTLGEEFGMLHINSNGQVEVLQQMPINNIPDEVLLKVREWYMLNNTLHTFKVA
jgi:hypothetical protein